MKPHLFGGTILMATVLVLAMSLSLARSAATALDSASSDFAGISPCDAQLKRMLGISDTAACEVAKWKLTLRYEDRVSGTFTLVCDYGMLEQGTVGLTRGAGVAQLQGTWSAARGTLRDPDALVYRLQADKGKVIVFQVVGTELLHLLDSTGRPMIGNAGWSYTLNRMAGDQRVETKAKLDPAGFQAPGDSDAAVAATVAFVGRTPGLDLQAHPKLKWDLTLHRDTATLAPTTFRVEGTLYRAAALEGTWKVSQGAAGDPDAEVYELQPPSGRPILLLRLDENVLMFLDAERRPRVGTANFSFTLNRADVRPGGH